MLVKRLIDYNALLVVVVNKYRLKRAESRHWRAHIDHSTAATTAQVEWVLARIEAVRSRDNKASWKTTTTTTTTTTTAVTVHRVGQRLYTFSRRTTTVVISCPTYTRSASRVQSAAACVVYSAEVAVLGRRPPRATCPTSASSPTRRRWRLPTLITTMTPWAVR